jgi:hypothetical protein
MRGKISVVNIVTPVNMLAAAGLRIEMNVTEAA